MDRFGEKVCCNPTVKLNKKEMYPLIDIDKINPGYKTVKSVSSVEYTGQGGAKFQDHDILFARITPCLENGKVAIADTNGQNGIGSTELFVFRGINGISDTDYIYYLLRMKHIRQLAANSMTGASGRQRADLGFIKRIQWDFPDIEIQKKIASVLSAYDSLIEVNNKRIKLLEQMAENLYKEWFVRFRFPGYETVEYENGLPKGWEYCTIESLSSLLQRGISPDYYDEGTLTVISQKCIRQNIMDIREARQQTRVFKPELNLQDGDTVICSTGTGTLGRVGQVYGDYPETTFDSHVTLVRAKNTVGKHFLYWTLKGMQLWFMNMGIGSTNQQELYRSVIKKAKALKPDGVIMDRFESFIDPIHRNIIALVKEQENLIKQRDFLLPRLMSRKLEV